MMERLQDSAQRTEWIFTKKYVDKNWLLGYIAHNMRTIFKSKLRYHKVVRLLAADSETKGL